MFQGIGKPVNLPQGELLWKQIRKICVTGTESSSLLNPDTWDTLDRNKKAPLSNFKSKAMERGNRLEPVARKALERKLGILFKPAVFMSKEERMLASLDGIALGRIATCEIKCPEKGQFSDTWEKALRGEIPRNYLTQMQYGLLLSGAPKCYYWVYDDQLDDGVLIEVKRDTIMHSEFLSGARRYWAEREDRRNKTVIYNDDKEAMKFAAEYAYWKDEAKKVNDRLKDAEQKLKEYAIEAADITVINNVELSIKESVGSIDYKKALLDSFPNIDLETYRREPKEPYSISIKVNDDRTGNNDHAENLAQSA